MSETRLGDLPRRQVAALERIAHEACAISGTLELVLRHLVEGDKAREEIAREAETLRRHLAAARSGLSAAIAADKSTT